MIEKDKNAIKDYIAEQSDLLNKGMSSVGEITISDEDITEEGWKAYEISFDDATALENFPPQIIYYTSTWEGSFEDEWDYNIDVDPDVFDIYKEEFSAEISNKIYGLLESYITERLEYYPDDYEGVSDFVEVEKVKDQNLKSQLKGLERKLFPED